MASLATLKINFVAYTAGFHAGVKSLRYQLNGFKRDASNAMFTLRRWGTLITGAAIGGGLAYLTNSVMNTYKEIGVMAERVQMTAKELIGFQFAALQSGIGVESFNRGLEIFVQRMGQFRMGAEAVKKPLEALGLSYERLSRMPVGEQLKTIADAFSKIQSPAEKAALTFMLFGRGGKEFINVLEIGREGMEKFQLMAKRFGLTFSKEEINKLKEMRIKMESLRLAVSALWGKILLKLQPVIKALTNSFLRLVLYIRDHAEEIVKAIPKYLKFIAMAYAGIKAFHLTVVAIKAATAAIKAYAAANAACAAISAATNPAALIHFAAALGAAAAAVGTVNYIFKRIEETVKDSTRSLKDFNAELNKTAKYTKEALRMIIEAQYKEKGVKFGEKSWIEKYIMPFDFLRALFLINKYHKEGIPGLKIWRDIREQLSQEEEKAAAIAEDSAYAQKQISEAVQKTVDKLGKEYMALRYTNNELEILELKTIGASKAQLNMVSSMQKFIDKTKFAKESIESIDKALKSLHAEVEAIGKDEYQRKYEDFVEQLPKNLGILNPLRWLTEYAKMIGKAQIIALKFKKNFEDLKSTITPLKALLKTPIDEMKELGETLGKGVKEGLLTSIEAMDILAIKAKELAGNMKETMQLAGAGAGARWIHPILESPTAGPEASAGVFNLAFQSPFGSQYGKTEINILQSIDRKMSTLIEEGKKSFNRNAEIR